MIFREYLKKSYGGILGGESLSSILRQIELMKEKYPKIYSELNADLWKNLLIEASEISISNLEKELNYDNYDKTVVSNGNRLSKYEMFDFPISVMDKNVSVNINIDRVKKYLSKIEIVNNRKLKKISQNRRFKSTLNIRLSELMSNYIQPNVYFVKDYVPSDSKLNEPILLLKWDVFNVGIKRKTMLIDGNNRLHYFMNQNDESKRIKVKVISPKSLVLSNAVFTCLEEVILLFESLLTDYMVNNKKNSKRSFEYLRLARKRLSISIKNNYFI